MIVEYLATDEGFVKKIAIDSTLNNHNDMVVFYVTFIKNKIYFISDDKHVLFDINPDLKEPTEEINEILKKYRLGFSNGEIFTHASKDGLEEKESAFAKALTEIAEINEA